MGTRRRPSRAKAGNLGFASLSSAHSGSIRRRLRVAAVSLSRFLLSSFVGPFVLLAVADGVTTYRNARRCDGHCEEAPACASAPTVACDRAAAMRRAHAQAAQSAPFLFCLFCFVLPTFPPFWEGGSCRPLSALVYPSLSSRAPARALRQEETPQESSLVPVALSLLCR